MSRTLKEQLGTYLDREKAKAKAAVKQQKKEQKQRVYGDSTPEISSRPAARKEEPGEESRKSGETFAQMMANSGMEKADFDRNKASKRDYSSAAEAEIIREAGRVKQDIVEHRPEDHVYTFFRKETEVELPGSKRSQKDHPKKSVAGSQIVSGETSKEGVKNSTAGARKSVPVKPVRVKRPAKKDRIEVRPQPPEYTINVEGPILPNIDLVTVPKLRDLVSMPVTGTLQVEGGNKNDERELNIGLDFGTSSVKVVIGDPVLQRAYAVPFYQGTGLEQYLLPSRVWRNGGGYSLEKADRPFRNLKLQLTKKDFDSEVFAAASAFLAFVIRHARDWLLTEHRETYSRSEILWKLTLGLPAEGYNSSLFFERFQKLAGASWLISLSVWPDFEEETVHDVCGEAQHKSLEEFLDENGLLDVEFDVVPELSAQIYGFLESDRFDPNARNDFMIIDVGAGTIDSSVFNVRRGRAHKLDFKFYANSVEFNGVANLNNYRVDWLREAFRKENVGNGVVDEVLDEMQTPTDFMNAIPESITDYFSGVDIRFRSSDMTPDHVFFAGRVKKQILANTLKKAVEGVGSDEYFGGMPVFVCGGGSRMKFYKEVENHLLYHPNASWFRYNPRKLVVPDMLEVPGVVQEDFDRLSVAFGLSFVDVGKTVRAEKIPRVEAATRQPRCPWCKSYTGCYCT